MGISLRQFIEEVALGVSFCEPSVASMAVTRGGRIPLPGGAETLRNLWCGEIVGETSGGTFACGFCGSNWIVASGIVFRVRFFFFFFFFSFF